MSSFKIIRKDENSSARAGILKTSHGEVQTPSYVIVGTNAEVRCLKLEDLPETKTQIIIANTYHLWREADFKIENLENLYEKSKWQIPTMTDSGGFQIFSLGFAREHKVGKIASIREFEDSSSSFWKKFKKVFLNQRNKKNLVRIKENGVYFFEGGKRKFLDAEKSILIQEKLGADIILAFDECTSPFHGFEYTKQAMERTHRWALRSLKAKKRNNQLLYGIVQGGVFKSLREESSKFISNLPFDGFAIGGSFGIDSESGGTNFKELEWSIPNLPEEKPRHLLGVGKIKDLFEAVERGIDTFDCVIPTREARHGAIWTSDGRFAIKRGVYKNDCKKLEGDCKCPVCDVWNIRRKDLHELFKTKNPNTTRFATIHNIYFFNNLMEKIRHSILNRDFLKFKEKFLN